MCVCVCVCVLYAEGIIYFQKVYILITQQVPQPPACWHGDQQRQLGFVLQQWMLWVLEGACGCLCFIHAVCVFDINHQR